MNVIPPLAKMFYLFFYLLICRPFFCVVVKRLAVLVHGGEFESRQRKENVLNPSQLICHPWLEMMTTHGRCNSPTPTYALSCTRFITVFKRLRGSCTRSESESRKKKKSLLYLVLTVFSWSSLARYWCYDVVYDFFECQLVAIPIGFCRKRRP